MCRPDRIQILHIALLLFVCSFSNVTVINATGPIGDMSKIRIPFIANCGQADDDIAFYAHTFAGTVYINRESEIGYTVRGKGGNPYSIKERLVDNIAARPSVGEPGRTRISNFTGADPSLWKSAILSYDAVDFGEVYDHISLTLKAYGNNVEKLFRVNPGGDPDDILIRIEGADHIRINDRQEVELMTGTEVVSFTRPMAYQEIAGTRVNIEVSYRVEDNGYGFAVGDYNKDVPLIIDPLLSSTYLGGSGAEGGGGYASWLDIAVAANGDVIVAGMTESTDFPVTVGSFEEGYGGGPSDIFIARMDPDLTAVLACAFLGGSGDEHPYNKGFLELASDGTIYVSGTTNSANFPTTPGAYWRYLRGGSDVFISHISADLSTLLASTYFGGYGSEYRGTIALDASDHVFVGGITDHQTFPTITGAYDPTYAGNGDFFVSKLNADLTTLLASTFVGGSFIEDYISIAVNGAGDVFVAGGTGSEDYPRIEGSYDDTHAGQPGNEWVNMDCCITKLDNNLSSVLASTFVGGDGYEAVLHLCLDPNGDVIISGHTWDTAYPVTPGAFDEVYDDDEYYISRLDADLTTLVASTFTTPENITLSHIYEMATSPDGEVYAVGVTAGDDLPITPYAYDEGHNGLNDGFIQIFVPDLSGLEYSSYLGGSGNDGIAAICMSGDSSAYVVGYTTSSDFPVSPTAYDDEFTVADGENDAFVARVTFDQFTRITDGPHVSNSTRSSGICWVDYNHDDYPDIYETNARQPINENNCLYVNNGDGTFTQVTNLAFVVDNSFSTSAAWADYDNDGDLDLFVTAHSIDRNQFYINNGDGTFTLDTTTPMDPDNIGSTTLGWVDYDSDGYLDLFIGNSTCISCPGDYPPYRNFLFKNVNGVFSEITSGDIVTRENHTYGATWCDFDNDGDLDLVAPGSPYEADYTDLYRNQGGGDFDYLASSVLCQTQGIGSSSSWADYDNDGDMDLLVTAEWPGPSPLYQNDGSGIFTPVADHGLGLLPGRSINGSWADYDNDGDQDLLIWANIFEFEDVFDSSLGFLFENDHGVFTQIPDTIIFSDSGLITTVVWADYDRDGDLDLYVPMYRYHQIGSTNMFFENNGNSNNWITIKCVGTNSNISAIGARVRIKADIFGSPVTQMREITSQVSANTQPPLEAHFGLGDATLIDSVVVIWPSGAENVQVNVPVNQFLVITEVLCGDANGDRSINVGDAVYIINFVFKDGPPPNPQAAGDANNDGSTNVGDAVYVINHVFKGGPGPAGGCG